jgi:hypothetical protein
VPRSVLVADHCPASLINKQYTKECRPANSFWYTIIENISIHPVAMWSKVWDFGRVLAGIMGSNPTWGEGHRCLCVVSVCVLSGRSLCDGLITRPEASYRVWFV